jgi:hypothetical protein
MRGDVKKKVFSRLDSPRESAMVSLASSLISDGGSLGAG